MKDHRGCQAGALSSRRAPRAGLAGWRRADGSAEEGVSEGGRGHICPEAFERPSVSFIHVRGPGPRRGGRRVALGAGQLETVARAAEPPPAFSCGHGQSELCHSRVLSWYLPGAGLQGWTWGRAAVPLQVPGTGVGSFPGAQAQPGPQGSRVDPPGALETLKARPGLSGWFLCGGGGVRDGTPPGAARPGSSTHAPWGVRARVSMCVHVNVHVCSHVCSCVCTCVHT